MIDVPRFRLKSNVYRHALNRSLIVLFVGIFIYLLFLVNYILANLSLPIELTLIIVVGILVFSMLQALVSYVKYSNLSYDFYDTHMNLMQQTTFKIEYSSIKKVSYSHNLMDKWFKTSTIVLELENKTIKLKHLINGNQAYFFLQKSVRESISK